MANETPSSADSLNNGVTMNAAINPAGDVDWFVDRFLLPATKEIARAGYHAAINVGIPLKEHPKNAELKGL